ncbi:DNA polymerase III subunit alpha [Candidatus Gracilibacteria bacterium]|nr:DNA polymerase III subunit alpha [Candidatus Gracilibacteria bacterium]
MSFIHLHTHSHYSLLEGIAKPKDLIKKAKSLGMSAVALTDTGNIHGLHELYKYAKEEGITPILGAEIYTQSELDEKLLHKLVLLATSNEGYKNLIQIVTKASLDNAGKTARTTLEVLRQYSSGIVCLSGPVSSEISYYILSGKSEVDITARIEMYQEIFGKDNYFLELLYHSDIPKQEFITEKLIELHKKYEYPLVACQNVYYVEKEDKKTQDVIMALGTGHEVENPDRPTLIRGEYHFSSQEEMQMQFGFLPSALENTQKIADRVDISISMGDILIPKFYLPENEYRLYNEYQDNLSSGLKKLDSDEWYLRYLSYIGLNWRYEEELSEIDLRTLIEKLDQPGLQKKLTETSPEELKELSLTFYSDEKKKLLEGFSDDMREKITRLEYELVVVHEMGFDAYFLIVADYIGWARREGIPVGPGRGSAAGSLMAYLTGITDIDPLPYDLLFERFLNPARISMPDIDTDFADVDRDKVVEYCRQKYGEDHVAQICTFGTFAARAAVKDVGRVMGVPFSEMNELGKLIPEKPGTKLAKALEEAPEFKQMYETNPKYKAIIDTALKIEGNVRQLGVHACAVIIAPRPMTDFTALAHPPKDAEAVVTQFSAYPLEDLGLLKMDFLGLRNLTIIKRALKIIKNTTGDEIDMSRIPLNDSKVFATIFAKGDTTGVFQFESDGMRKYLKDLAPDRLEDLIAMVSLYRPGPLAYIPSYVERKHGREAVEYMLPKLREELAKYGDEVVEEERRKLEEDLRKILDVSYGIAVYQEQLMFIVQYMAGFSLGEADLLRRGVGKKIASVVEKLKGEFIEKAASFKNYKPETSRFIYEEMIQPAANYSFNKSHAACYALIAYQTAYLKTHYRTQFLTSMMVSDEENMDRIKLEVAEAKNHGIGILPPDVNESMKHFTFIDEKNIRFGLKAIKGLGDGPIAAIIDTRSEKKFSDIDDFMKRAGREVLNKKSLEALIFAGAMDVFGERGSLLASIENILRSVKAEEKKQASSQIGLFDMIGGESQSFELEKVLPMSFEKKLTGEKEVLGYMVSGHPLDGLKKYVMRRSKNTKYLKESLYALQMASEKNKEKFQEELQKNQVSVVAVLSDMRKIMTKNGKVMVFLSCESYDADFEATLFDKQYQEVKNDLEIGKVLILDGSFTVNFDYGRKGLRIRSLRLVTLSQVREQAKSHDLFGTDKRVLRQAEIVTQSLKQDTKDISPKMSENNHDIQSSGDNSDIISEDFEEILEEKIQENKLEKSEKNPKSLSIEIDSSDADFSEKYIVDIPSGTKLEQIHALKAFLETQKSGDIKIYILLQGQEVDTKCSLAKLHELQEWEKENL